jgi:hypothetical protein
MDDEFKQQILEALNRIENRVALLERNQKQLTNAYARSRFI